MKKENLVTCHVLKAETAIVKKGKLIVTATINQEVLDYLSDGENVIDIHIMDKDEWAKQRK